MIRPTITNTLYQYRTVRPTFSISHPRRLAASDPSSHRRSTTGTANSLSHLRFFSPARTLLSPEPNHTRPNPMHAWTRAANDGLRPKTYPPQRYLERTDLTNFLVFNASIFSHNISMRLFRSALLNLQISCSPWHLNCLGEVRLQRSSWPKRNPISVSFGIRRNGKDMR